MGYYRVIIGYSGLLWVMPGYYGVLSCRFACLSVRPY